MFESRGIPIFEDEMSILQNIRAQVYIQQSREILRKMKSSGDNIMVCCPAHSNGQERNPSCGILITRRGDKPPGTVHCFACGYTDDFKGFVSTCFGYDDGGIFGEKWLLDNYLDGEFYERPSIFKEIDRNKKEEKEISYITEEELQRYRYYHPYMFQRKLTKEIIEKYDVGYQKNFQLTKDSPKIEVLTFPVRDEEGRCIFISRRAIYQKKFFLPSNLDKPIYGLYELPQDCDEVIVCESIFNALTCVIYGRPAVALFGTGTSSQYEKLSKLPVRKYILGFDPDYAGNKGLYRFKKNVKSKLLTTFLIPEQKDINDLSLIEFNNLKQKFI